MKRFFRISNDITAIVRIIDIAKIESVEFYPKSNTSEANAMVVMDTAQHINVFNEKAVELFELLSKEILL